MSARLLLFCFFALPAVAYADAGDGQFMGYELGAKYPTPALESEFTTTGNLLITAKNPTKPADITQVNLVSTPKTQVIGYIVASSWFSSEGEARAFGRKYAELLQAKYPDWELGQEKMDENFDLVEVNFEQPPHNLKLNLSPDEQVGRSMWRVSMALGWSSDSEQQRSWQEQAATEQRAAKSSEHEQLMENSDMRGL